jgi:predicted amidohydrolase
MSVKADLYLDPVPMDLAWQNPRENIRRMRAEIESRLSARPELASESRLFVFPETTLTGFVTASAKDHALKRDGEEVEAVRALARELKTAIVFGFPEDTAKEPNHLGARALTNTLLFLDPKGRELADYQKIHLFTAGVTPTEDQIFQGGQAGVIVEYRGWKIGLAICFDLRFPGLFHEYAREGAELVILPACWIPGPGKSYQFQTLSAAHAIMGQYYFLSLNRSGQDPAFVYEGEALLYAPTGEKLTDRFPFQLTEDRLLQSRKLSVRASDQESYPVIFSS